MRCVQKVGLRRVGAKDVTVPAISQFLLIVTVIVAGCSSGEVKLIRILRIPSY